MLPRLSLLTAMVALSGGCTVFALGNTPCDADADCGAGRQCAAGFCTAGGEEGEPGEGEGEAGEGEAGEGEAGEGEAGEGEGDAGEGEGDAGGEGEGEGDAPPATVTLCGEEHLVPAWFDPTFPFRVPFAFCDVAAPNENVDGLPVTVILDVASFPELASIAADGRDVIFVDERGTPATLKYERQIYADNSKAVFNVRVPRFNPSTGLDDVWMYFGSNDGIERNDVVNTYPDYSSVWHFEAGALLTEARSGVVLSGNRVSAATGLIGGGIGMTGQSVLDGDASDDSFAFLQPFRDNGDGTGDAVPPPTPPSSSSASYSMLSAPRSFSTAGENGEFTMIISDLNTLASGCVDAVSICSLFFNDGSYQVFVPGLSGLISSAAGVVPLNQLKHHSLSWGAGGVQGTFDGALVVSSAAPSQATFPVENIVLGMAEQADNGSFNGVIDELRISNVPRVPSFYRAEAKAYAGALLERGIVEAR